MPDVIHACTHDWPVGRDGDEPTTRALFEVLDAFDVHYPAAVEGLAEVGRESKETDR